MKRIPILLKVGGIDKDARRGLKDMGRRLGENEVYGGLCSSRTNTRTKNKEYVIWINSRQNEREFIDTFFHEFTHMVCHYIGFRTVNEEALCRWIGYLAKSQFADACPSRFGRRIERKRKAPSSINGREGDGS